MIGPTDLFHPSLAPHFKTSQVFLIYCPKRPSFSSSSVQVPHVVKKIPSYCETKRFIPVFTAACLLSTSSARWLQVMSIHTTALSYILILSTFIHLGLPSGLFTADVPNKTLHAFVFSHIHAVWPAHLIVPDLLKLTDFLRGTHHEVFCILQLLPPT
jgi:hypothetical protein